MTKNTTLIATLVLALNILIVWLPTRFDTAAAQEEWRIRALFDGNIVTYGDSGNESSDEIFITRPVIGVMNHLAYRLSPDSFISHHIILMLSLFGKGLVLFLIIKRLIPDVSLWAYVCATLLTFYPSDPAIVSLRVIHTHFAIVMILLSIYFLILYYQQQRTLYLILMWASQLIAGLTIEIGYPIFFFAPLLILLLEKRISRRFIITTILFYIVPALTFAYSLYLIVGVRASWQDTALVRRGIRDYARTIFDLYQYNLVTTWENVIASLQAQLTPADIAVFGFTTVFTFVGGVLISRHQELDDNKSAFFRQWLLVGCIGGTTILLGYAMFLLSRTHILTHYRVYLLSSVGVAIVIGTVTIGLYYLLRQYKIQFIAVLGVSVLVGLSSLTAHRYHLDYNQLSQQQESIVRQLTTHIPALSQPAYIVIKTPSNETNRRIDLGELQKPVLFTPMLQYLYNDYENIKGGVICFKEYLTCDFSSSDSMDIQASNFLNLDLPIAYDEMILLNITRDGEILFVAEDETLSGYNPIALIDTTAPQPTRITTIYGTP